MAWLSGYSYRKLITITGSVGCGNNYQILLKVGESSGAGGSDFHVEEHSEIFPSTLDTSGDIRFTTSDGETELNFYVEAVSGTTPNRIAYIWIKVTADLDSNQTIYCYYGKSGASNVSDGTNTFLMFDDFGDGSIGVEWTQEPNGITISETGGEFKIDGNNANEWTSGDTAPKIYQNTTETKFRVRVKINNFQTTANNHQAHIKIKQDNQNWIKAGHSYESKEIVAMYKNISNVAGQVGSADFTGTLVYIELIYNSGQSTSKYSTDRINWTQIYANYAITLTTRNICLEAYGAGATCADCYFDDFFVTKYNTTEPSFSSASSETGNCKISGYATLDGEGVSGATIYAFDSTNEQYAGKATTNESGYFEIEGLSNTVKYHCYIEYSEGDNNYNAKSYWDIDAIEV